MLSDLVARESGVPVSKLAPVVGEYVFSHKSPSHLELPALFEAFDPSVTGVERKLTRS
jgi:isopropylmalate/homocitrate/citramalate synthase